MNQRTYPVKKREELKLRIDKLAFGGKPHISFFYLHKIIINKPDKSKKYQGQKKNIYIMIGQVSPDCSGHENRRKDQDTAHCRRPLLTQMGLWSIGLDDLSDLHLRKFFDNKRSKKKTD